MFILGYPKAQRSIPLSPRSYKTAPSKLSGAAQGAKIHSFPANKFSWTREHLYRWLRDSFYPFDSLISVDFEDVDFEDFASRSFFPACFKQRIEAIVGSLELASCSFAHQGTESTHIRYRPHEDWIAALLVPAATMSDCRSTATRKFSFHGCVPMGQNPMSNPLGHPLVSSNAQSIHVHPYCFSHYTYHSYGFVCK